MEEGSAKVLPTCSRAFLLSILHTLGARSLNTASIALHRRALIHVREVSTAESGSPRRYARLLGHRCSAIAILDGLLIHVRLAIKVLMTALLLD